MPEGGGGPKYCEPQCYFMVHDADIPCSFNIACTVCFYRNPNHIYGPLSSSLSFYHLNFLFSKLRGLVRFFKLLKLSRNGSREYSPLRVSAFLPVASCYEADVIIQQASLSVVRTIVDKCCGNRGIPAGERSYTCSAGFCNQSAFLSGFVAAACYTLLTFSSECV